jgi:hypothetical protein
MAELLRQAFAQAVGGVAIDELVVRHEGQESANDNNQNQKYPKLDERIQATYGAR